MPDTEMVIFSRTFDFLSWLLPLTNHFPKAHRHTVTRRLLDSAFDFHERIQAANHRMGSLRRDMLYAADEALANVRLYIRLAVRWKWMNQGQYRHAGTMLAEIGRLLGGWQKSTK
jgi:hypothetical protein